MSRTTGLVRCVLGEVEEIRTDPIDCADERRPVAESYGHRRTVAGNRPQDVSEVQPRLHRADRGGLGRRDRQPAYCEQCVTRHQNLRLCGDIDEEPAGTDPSNRSAEDPGPVDREIDLGAERLTQPIEQMQARDLTASAIRDLGGEFLAIGGVELGLKVIEQPVPAHIGECVTANQTDVNTRY